MNASVLNNPAFRASGWQPNASDIKRTYSPPIPTAVTAEYFQAPRSLSAQKTTLEDDDEIGMVTGVGSNETVGPNMYTKRRRRKEQMEQDDSSDLSEESDDEPEFR